MISILVISSILDVHSPTLVQDLLGRPPPKRPLVHGTVDLYIVDSLANSINFCDCLFNNTRSLSKYYMHMYMHKHIYAF